MEWASQAGEDREQAAVPGMTGLAETRAAVSERERPMEYSVVDAVHDALRRAVTQCLRWWCWCLEAIIIERSGILV